MKSDKNHFDVSIGLTIRRMRLLRGMTQQQLAQQLEVSFQQLQKYELGSNKISFERLCRLCSVLDVPLALWASAVSAEQPAQDEHYRQLLGLMQHYQRIAAHEHRALLCALARALAA